MNDKINNIFPLKLTGKTQWLIKLSACISFIFSWYSFFFLNHRWKKKHQQKFRSVT